MRKYRLLSLVILLVLVFTPSAAGARDAQISQTAGNLPIAYTGQFRISNVDSLETASAGAFNSIVFVPGQGKYYISYYDATLHSLRWAFPVDPGTGNCGDGLAFLCATLDGDGAGGHSADDVGMYSDIDVYQGPSSYRIGISYYDKTHGHLKYIENNCIFGICKWTIYVVDDLGLFTNMGGYGTSLSFDKTGNPYIAYSYNTLDVTKDALKVAHWVVSGGNCGSGGNWQCDYIDVGEGRGRYPSIDSFDGVTMHIATYDGANNILRYAINSGPGCGTGTTVGWTCTPIDLHGGKWPSLQVESDGVVDIASYDPVSGYLRYATYTGDIPAANCGLIELKNRWRCDNIEQIGTGLSQVGVSLGLDGADGPAIAYMKTQEQGPSYLRIARPDWVLGQLIGNCGPVPQGGLFSTWTCTTLDGGGSWQDEAAHASIALRPDGLAVVAYLEEVSQPVFTRLKVAEQRTGIFIPSLHQSALSQ